MPEEGCTTSESGFAAGNADNLVQLGDAIRDFGADVLIVMSADHVFNLDLRPVVREHLERSAHCTIVTAEVTKGEARHKGVVTVDDSGRVTAFDDKPSRPSATTVATEIVLYEPAILLDELRRLRAELSHDDEDGSSGLGDFGAHLLPALVACRIGRGAVVGAEPAATRARDADITMLGQDCSVGASAVVEPGARLEPGSSARPPKDSHGAHLVSRACIP